MSAAEPNQQQCKLSVDWTWFETVLADIGFVFRQIRRNPAFTAVALYLADTRYRREHNPIQFDRCPDVSHARGPQS